MNFVAGASGDNGGNNLTTVTAPAGVTGKHLGIIVVNSVSAGTSAFTLSAAGWVNRVSNPTGQNNQEVQVWTKLGGHKAGDVITVTRAAGNSATHWSALWYDTAGRDVEAVSTPYTRAGASLATTLAPGVAAAVGRDIIALANTRVSTAAVTLTSWSPALTQDFFADTTTGGLAAGHFTQTSATGTDETATFSAASGNGVGVQLALSDTPTTVPLLLDSGTNTTDGVTFQTASITPSPNKLLLLSILMAPGSATTVAAPTVTGCGLNWVQIDINTGGASTRKSAMYRAMGPAPTTGPLTITVASTATIGSIVWFVTEHGGVDTSGTDGSGAIAQEVQGAPTATLAPSVNLPNPPATGNQTFGIIGCATAQAQTPGTGYTQLDFQSAATPAIGAQIEYADPPQQAISGTFSSTAQNSFVVGVEVKMGSAKIDKAKVGASSPGMYVGASPVTAAYVGTTQVWP
jgi:hypothetical protein